jgi:glycosyltransferase involved in cell wall biosynthesis
MRVLFLTTVAEDSGIHVLSEDIAGELQKKGIKVDIDRGKGKYDLIHIHNALPGNLAYAKIFFPKTPIVYSTNMTQDELMGLVPDFLIGLAKHYLNFFYSQCNAIICCSPKIAKKMKETPFRNNCFYYPNPINVKKFSFDKKKRETFRKKFGLQKKTVLSVGSIQKRKGIFEFAETAERLKQFDFVWAGNIPNVPTLEGRKRIEKIMENKNNNIKFLGFLNREEIVEAYCGCDLFVFPTHAETFGLVIAEAAAVGLPVLIRKLPEFKMFEEFAEMFSTQEEMERKMKKILDCREFYETKKKQSLEHSKKFDLEKYCDWLIGFYNGVLEKKKKE